MSFDFLFTFAVGALVGFLNPIIFASAAGIFLRVDKARIAGFSFALGMFVAVPQLTRTDTIDGVPLLAGAALGLAVVWSRLFRRSKVNG